jgi:hypothetical protein
VSAKNECGKTPLDVASNKMRLAIKQYFRQTKSSNS